MKDVPRLVLTHPDGDQLLTVQEFAAALRVSPKTIYRRIKDGTQRGLIECGREYRINVRVALARYGRDTDGEVKGGKP